MYARTVQCLLLLGTRLFQQANRNVLGLLLVFMKDDLSITITQRGSLLSRAKQRLRGPKPAAAPNPTTRAEVETRPDRVASSVKVSVADATKPPLPKDHSSSGKRASGSTMVTNKC